MLNQGRGPFERWLGLEITSATVDRVVGTVNLDPGGAHPTLGDHPRRGLLHDHREPGIRRRLDQRDAREDSGGDREPDQLPPQHLRRAGRGGCDAGAAWSPDAPVAGGDPRRPAAPAGPRAFAWSSGASASRESLAARPLRPLRDRPRGRSHRAGMASDGAGVRRQPAVSPQPRLGSERCGCHP